MSREELISLIKVAEGILKIEEGCRILSGAGFEMGEGADMYLLWEVIRSHSAPRFQKVSDIDDDSEQYQAFVEVLESKELSAEEKFEQLAA